MEETAQQAIVCLEGITEHASEISLGSAGGGAEELKSWTSS